MYRVKRIEFRGHQVPIVLQNENGPCPLLAICPLSRPFSLLPGNILLLERTLSIHEDIAVIALDTLLSMVESHVVQKSPPVCENLTQFTKQETSTPELQALGHAVDEAISILPKMSVGLDVNVKFTSCACLPPPLTPLACMPLNQPLKLPFSIY